MPGSKDATEPRTAFGVRGACWRCRESGVARKKREQAPRTPNASRGGSSTPLTAEELDFILNYGLQYRLGRDAEAQEE